MKTITVAWDTDLSQPIFTSVCDSTGDKIKIKVSTDYEFPSASLAFHGCLWLDGGRDHIPFKLHLKHTEVELSVKQSFTTIDGGIQKIDWADFFAQNKPQASCCPKKILAPTGTQGVIIVDGGVGGHPPLRSTPE